MRRLDRVILRALIPPSLLNRVNSISHLEDRFLELETRFARLAGVLLRERYPQLFAGEPPVAEEFGIYSQNGEDGVLLGILAALPAPPHRAVEIGIENGRECNTALLGFALGWDCLMVDLDPLGCAAARKLAARVLARQSNRVVVRECSIHAENINTIVAEESFHGPLGVLSIDVDGVDYWLWKALSAATPDVVVMEYNACYGPDRSITSPYDPQFDGRRIHASGFYGGASLLALEKLGREKGYSLVAVESRGVNAFFVREEIRPATLPVRTAAELFRPHYERSKICSPAEQWKVIAHLPFVEV